MGKKPIASFGLKDVISFAPLLSFKSPVSVTIFLFYRLLGFIDKFGVSDAHTLSPIMGLTQVARC